MDTHIRGPRGVTKGANQNQPIGAISSILIAGVKFGDPALTAKEIFRTDGAKTSAGSSTLYSVPNRRNPLFVVIWGHIPVTFDGSVPSPVFSLTETNLDDSGSVTIAAIANFTAGLFNTYKVITVDKKYKLTYTLGGSATVGEGYYIIGVAGPGYSALY